MIPERPIVIDASVALALLLGEPEAPLVARALSRWASDERRIVVPSHFWLEVVNRLTREPDMPGTEALGALHRLDTFHVETFEVGRAILVHVIDRAERFRLTAYDAAYLVVAEHLDAELATFDQALTAAAGPRAVTFDENHRLHERPFPYGHDVTWPNYKEASAYLARLRAEALAGRG